jgi:hypothetical protein
MAGEEQIRDDYAAVLTDPSAGLVRRALEALNVDLNALLFVVRSEEGLRQFRDKIHAVEGACGTTPHDCRRDILPLILDLTQCSAPARASALHHPH